ncbi:DUF4956 domain-containing protein [Wenyingzhuangia sp. 2_MG-2023]|uniref:DUF4956 domain-containing protein n=1 Tax=Wenyingzhuangia sp. 2_MG-2023 TaxID=3062639 RepID=UPI0026E1CE54|nr:DUF4956 domain-containing protein [Wenyingzhuangia sp. 2_MG-2023]MDO6738131.1 DUF4956 domain-containing protein [Wenyingzhuangia sp. 2_MG-2023]MDO6801545.1 DUF4956 domain-containing protein [Wenyingzhuangia sp. 1_MG-2023]
MEIYGIPIFDDDFYKMLFRFCINTGFLTIIIRCLYYKNARNKEFFFTYYMISVIVFFLCFTLKKFELDLGMALGLFAIFGIIRYRTNSIEIKEMTYLFVVIGVSVINSLANKKMSYIEVFSANLLIILVLSLTEKFWSLKHQVSRKIIYDVIENLKPENDKILKEDLKNKTGFDIEKIKIEEVDFRRKRANMIIYYENK